MSSKTRTRKNRTTARPTGSARHLRSVPEQTLAVKVRTDSEDKLWAALHAAPNATAADLSAAAKIGKSTAQKILVKWEADGSVTRIAGITEGGRRAGDLWAITEVDTAQDSAAPVDTSPAEDAEAADTVQAEQSTPAAVEAAPEVCDPGDARHAEGDPTEPTDVEPTETDSTDAATDDTQYPADTETTTSPTDKPAVAEPSEAADDGAATGDGADAGKKKARLAPYSLRGMVEDYLRERPGEEFGPTAIAKALGGKSSGAVSNALDKLVDNGTAVRTKDKPRRFALTPAEQAAAPTPTN